MLDVESHTAFAQATHPAAQQGGGLEISGKHAAGTADNRFHALTASPGTQCIGIEGRKPASDLLLLGSVAGNKGRKRLRVSQIEPPFSGNQEFATNRALAFVDIHGDAGGDGDFGRHQAGRATTDNGQVLAGSISHPCMASA